MNDISRAKKSLREVLPRDGGKMRITHEDNLYSEPPVRTYTGAPRRGRRSWLMILIVVVVVALGAGFGLSKLFAQATVRVSPVQGRLLINHTFEAKKVPVEGELGFVVLSGVTDSEKKTLPAQGSEQVEKRASGTITIYNKYSSTGQRLITNTRFQTDDGKIYRIADAITVPGYKKSGSEITPGSIDVTVTADKTGPDYNIGLVDFTIPGFKGDPRYDKMYAKSKTPMTGGWSGQIKQISDTDKSKARAEMETALKERLLEEAKRQTPEGFILFADAGNIVFSESVNAVSGSDSSAEYVITGDFFGVILNKTDLARYVASQLVPDYDGKDVSIPNLDKLSFRLANKDSLTNGDLDRISFSLEGNASLVSVFNQEELINKLISASDSNYERVFAQFPNIDKAEIVFRPPWLRTVPKDAQKVKVEVVVEGQN